MNRLLEHIGCSQFSAISAVAGGWDILKFVKGRVEIVFSLEIESAALENHPVVVFQDTSEVPLSKLMWDMAHLTRLIFPTLTAYDWQSLERHYQVDTATRQVEQLAFMFLRWIGEVARMDLSDLSAAARVAGDDPLGKLMGGIVSYLTTQSGVSHPMPRIKRPKLPSHRFGRSQRVDEAESSLIEPEVIDEFFNTTLLRSSSAYEDRPSQKALARRVAQAFNDGDLLLAEAGTGTGKSLAYLVPSVLWSVQNSTQTVISTHTKNLQDQLFFKDIPLLAPAINFRAVLVKGRQNYLCRKKFESVCADPATHLKARERLAMVPLIFWASRSESGDVAECTGFESDRFPGLWQKLASDPVHCQLRKCLPTCPIRRVRDDIKNSHIVIVNHALLFSDLVASNAVLGEYGHAVFDEAHHLDKVAQDYLGVEFSYRRIRRLTQKIADREQQEIGLLIRIRKAIQKASWSPSESAYAQTLLANLADSCDRALKTGQPLLSTIEKQALHPAAPSGNGTIKVRYRSDDSPLRVGSDEKTDFEQAMANLSNRMTELLDSMRVWPDAVETDEFREQLERHLDELRLMVESFEFLAGADAANYVYWMEHVPSRKGDLRFYAVPLNVGDLLHDLLFSRLRAAVFSSATLSVQGEFDHTKRRMGLAHEAFRVDEISLRSPFDYSQQCRLYVVAGLPDPSRSEFVEAAADAISDAVLGLRRNTLVLFTSYQMMNQCHRFLKDSWKREGITLIVQGLDGSRTQLAEQMKTQSATVLFGTDSFWEGVDLPGEALEILIITKLPFEVPTEPLVAAKLEIIEHAGGRPFFDYSLPEAVLKFRQGFGRLIRQTSDRGIVIVLDSRITKKSYGRYFLDSVEAKAKTVSRVSEVVAEVHQFF